jgi:hypothetical protein
VVDAAFCRSVLEEELAKLNAGAETNARYAAAASLFRELVEAPSFTEFLTVPAYHMIIAEGS